MQQHQEQADTAGGSVPDRELNLREAAEMAGVTVRTLRKHLREDRLPERRGPDGEPVLRAGDLEGAGLLKGNGPAGPARPASRTGVARSRRRPTNRVESPPVQAEHGAWLPAVDAGDLLGRLLREREDAAADWKDRTESLYREIVEDQRARLDRLEGENRELTSRLHEALRQVPKLLELESVEASARHSREEAEQAEQRAAAAEAEAAELRSRVSRLEEDLERSESRRKSLVETCEQLRRRNVWARLVDRQPPLPLD